MKKPIVAISSGDPSGIGPEVTIKALAGGLPYAVARPVVISDAETMAEAIQSLNLDIALNIIDSPSEGKYIPGIIDLIDLKNVDRRELATGKPTAESGRASFEYVRRAIELAMNNDADATVTGPISKEAIRLAGFDFAGHTEIFAHFTGASDYAMMLADGDFRVVHVNTHVSMLKAIERITALTMPHFVRHVRAPSSATKNR